MIALYNEIDARAAAWLRELITQGYIAAGDVDARSVVDVRPSDLARGGQVHLFAGIGVWSYALRLAGWPDDRPVWTVSCPCQPFSVAGKRRGTADERHLWPVVADLVRKCRPAVILGEQVASSDGLGWLDSVFADLEDAGYACAASDLCAAGVGAPHIRQRLYWCAIRLADLHGDGRSEAGLRLSASGGHGAFGDGPACRMADADDARLEGRRKSERERAAERSAGADLLAGRMADAESDRHEWTGELGEQAGRDGAAHHGATGRPRPTDGFWRDADWLACRDGKWRPVEPGTFPLAHGAPARVGRLRGYGNAIVAPLAATFVASVMDVLNLHHAEWMSAE